ncbi:hypothetical protein PG993_007600 [Apiospora rasikravindrae]|uniref:Uncharacterized protein n=1 Tax=Apiospora rasikravindrae TaxID=990691 RepID=A0ABR1SXZ4_9PEZI
MRGEGESFQSGTHMNILCPVPGILNRHISSKEEVGQQSNLGSDTHRMGWLLLPLRLKPADVSQGRQRTVFHGGESGSVSIADEQIFGMAFRYDTYKTRLVSVSIGEKEKENNNDHGDDDIIIINNNNSSSAPNLPSPIDDTAIAQRTPGSFLRYRNETPKHSPLLLSLNRTAKRMFHMHSVCVEEEKRLNNS